MITTARYIHKHREQSLQIPSTYKVRGLCFVLIFLAFFANITGYKASAQDTNVIVPNQVPVNQKDIHSPRKAAIFAMVLPGLGQAYNHKYWKIPVVYTLFGSCIYFVHTNTKSYRELKAAYEYVSVTAKTVYPPSPVNVFRPLPDPPNDWAVKYTEEQLKVGRDFYRHRLEVSYIFTGVVYILSIVDAVVDAHFFDYDINDDLTLNVRPWVPALGSTTAYGVSGGINLTLRF